MTNTRCFLFSLAASFVRDGQTRPLAGVTGPLHCLSLQWCAKVSSYHRHTHSPVLMHGGRD